jgi:CRISPR-associated endonuclease Csn1
MAGNTLGPLTFGFDIGIASVGWCVLGESRIVDIGVRCFDKAETAKEGESLNLARRTARLMRAACAAGLAADQAGTPAQAHRTDRRSERDSAAAPPLRRGNCARTGLIAADKRRMGARHLPPVQASRLPLDQPRGREESRRRRQRRRWPGQEGAFRYPEAHGGKGYRSAAEMVLAEFPDRMTQRNKQGDYGKALSRVLLERRTGLAVPATTRTRQSACRNRTGNRHPRRRRPQERPILGAEAAAGWCRPAQDARQMHLRER